MDNLSWQAVVIIVVQIFAGIATLWIREYYHIRSNGNGNGHQVDPR